MTLLRCCLHGRARLRQRGFQANDHDRIFLLGVHISDQEIFLPEAVAAFEISLVQRRINALWRTKNHSEAGVMQEEIAEMKREIHQIERIRNRKIVVEDDVLITGYRPTPRHTRKCFRRLRSRVSRLHKWR